MVGLSADPFIDAENLLDDDDGAARRAFGFGQVGVEAGIACERRNLDHRHVGLHPLRSRDL
jgi:hypothetical protein